MRTVQILSCLLLSLCVVYQTGKAGSLNGTANIIYASTPQVFHTGDVVTGFVRINNGFSVAPAASVLFDTFITVSGGIDLKETGILQLNNDLRLESGVTFTTGGIISGRGHALVLGGTLTLTATTNVRALTIRSDTVFNGRGKTFVIGDRAQIFVENNVTLTLRNLVLKAGKYCQTPPIRLASQGSKLALDNVVVELCSDFIFKQGQMFIHQDVAFTGTSAFVYQSPRPSYIASGGVLMFDKGTTFSVAPASYTDGLSTATMSNFLVMQDPSASLFLNGSSLLTTNTGLQLTTGNLFLDNRVVFDSTATASLSGLSLVGSVGTGTNPFAISWSPDGRFIAVGNDGSATLQIYTFNGISAPTTVGGAVATGTNPEAVTWSPNGRYIAVANRGSNTLQIYKFNGGSSPTVVGSSVATGANPQSVAWSPDGRFIAVVHNTASTMQIYSFDGSNTPVAVGGTVATGSGPYAVSWSSDSRFIATVNNSSATLQVYRFNGYSAPVTVGSSVATGAGPCSIKWSPDGRFLVVANTAGGTIQVYKFSGATSPSVVGSPALAGASPRAVDWSGNGQYLAVCDQTDNNLRLYSFGGSTTPTRIGGTISTGLSANAVAWSPGGSFIAVVNVTSNTLQVFRLNYASNTNIPQALSKAIVFGNSSMSSYANLSVCCLGGAHVEVTGKVCDASV